MYCSFLSVWATTSLELEHAKQVSAHYGVPHTILMIDPQTFNSPHSLLTSKGKLPKNRTQDEMGKGAIPPSYVPARNTLFIANAIVQAEIFDANEIHLGPNKMDYHCYPDCRPPSSPHFRQVANLATKQATEGAPPRIVTPLIELDKSQIIELGMGLKAPLDLTFSCYDPLKSGAPCEQCDACVLRAAGFRTAAKQ